MTKPDWRNINQNDSLDTPSLWINFMDLPAQLDTEQSILKNNPAPHYDEYLFAPGAPPVPHKTPSHTAFRRHNSERQLRSGPNSHTRPHPARRCLHNRRTNGLYKTRVHCV